MAVKVKDVMKVMNEFAPLELAVDWDNCGLVAGDENQEVSKVYIALDPTLDIINEAIRNDVDMIVTHHPLLIHKINKINSITVEGRKFIKLIKNNISLYCAHTNLDQTVGGINELLAKKVGLINYEVLDVTGKDEAGNFVGFGKIGLLDKPVTLSELAQSIKSSLKLNSIRIVGDKSKLVYKIAVGSGNGMDALQLAISNQADVFITGDVKYHGAIMATENDICLIDAGHFGTENIVGELLYQLLSKELPQVELIVDRTMQDPIESIW